MAMFVFIDDNPDSVVVELRDAVGVNNLTVLVYPDAFEAEQAAKSKAAIEACSVVLMDLDLYGQDETHDVLKPGDGIALEDIIRTWFTPRAMGLDASPRAYVLFSHALEKLGGQLGYSGREHILARNTGNEWATSKNEGDRRPEHQQLNFLRQLADAVNDLPTVWPDDGDQRRTVAMSLLGLDLGSPWKVLASEDAERAGLPMQYIDQGNGMTLVRWLLHVALPFPSCLMDIRSIAVQLRLTPDVLVSDTELRDRLEAILTPYEYGGLLRSFLGKRWWRAGVLTFADQIADNDGGLTKGLAIALDVKASRLTPLDVPYPVLTVNDRFLLDGTVADASKCVRVLTEDWPDELERPWMAIDLAQTSSRLMSLVHPDDRYRLPETPQ